MPRLDLAAWIRDNQKHLKPPVSNKQLFADSKDAIIFVSGGPNTRNDFHVNPTEELFYQLKGDIAVRVRPLDGTPPRDVVIREGELFMLPRWVPHRPQRPAGTLGLIVEFPRGVDEHGKPQMDGLRWYCPRCDALVHEARWVLKKIDEDLKVIMEDFWGGSEERRACRSCGYVIKRAEAIELKDGKVSAAGSSGGGKGASGGDAKKAAQGGKSGGGGKTGGSGVDAKGKAATPSQPSAPSRTAEERKRAAKAPTAVMVAAPMGAATGKAPAKSGAKPDAKSDAKSAAKSSAKPSGKRR